jgi:hypothetical protein
MAHPLELPYNWRTPAFFASLAAAICIGVLARARATGWLSALIVAPVALLRGGHSALFTWILVQAPQAQLDKRSRRTAEQLKTRGLIP